MSFVIKYTIDRLKESTKLSAQGFEILIYDFKKVAYGSKRYFELSEFLVTCSYVPMEMAEAGYIQIVKGLDERGNEFYYTSSKEKDQVLDTSVAGYLSVIGKDSEEREYYRTRVLISKDGRVAVEVAVPSLQGEANKDKVFTLAQNLAQVTGGELAPVFRNSATGEIKYTSSTFIFPPDWLI